MAEAMRPIPPGNSFPPHGPRTIHPMTAQHFKTKWSQAAANERQWYQEHFTDLCDLVGHPHPSGVNRHDQSFIFEYPLTKTIGGKGFADVWKSGSFGWEYKGPNGNLDAAYNQLLGYKGRMNNPPLLPNVRVTLPIPELAPKLNPRLAKS